MAFQDLYEINEIEYDREKAASLGSEASNGPADAAHFLHAARDRGSQWVTRRRLREATRADCAASGRRILSDLTNGSPRMRVGAGRGRPAGFAASSG
jgi:hypothetical protein